ncbi:bifunctional folylpolyglutamate synthase/dihydrofolate synthase [Sphingomonas sp. RHCKR47]|uniref:bifunctional folylpolyglutamate synthase/dihydrofolate synthase n=1 Tax=Sphingomonas citricola TaxID=2862498 RepID=UPI001CA58B59|nr:folylpolyglutamate synthase/dihydrofolate synthase family protein [Sphingomonas citricola]MBW6523641.1 bifunctional folylpolyglutamate synthase/dihydrofolate synthase [Sphingomonas citricola]
MPDHARSTDPAVQAQLERLWALSPGADVLGLERITRLLTRLGNPHRRLPPVFHVAGTNGKGSTCAFLRAAIEAAGYRVHSYTSPHLVRFNERIRLSGTLIDDATLANLLRQVLDVADDIGASFFEVTTAAAFLAFATTPADACVIEVGLGGRLDATNVIPTAAVCGIAALGMDHEAFLGDTLPKIAAEKAGIAKSGVPLVTMAYPPEITAVIRRAAEDAGAPLLAQGFGWNWEAEEDALRYRDEIGESTLPLPSLRGAHQPANFALATAMLRHQRALIVSDEAIADAAATARWPARLQRLSPGPLTDLVPPGTAIWLDGGHNPSAGEALARSLPRRATATGITMILGMLANKDPAGFLRPMASHIDRVIGVPVPDHASHAPDSLAQVAQELGIPVSTTADNVAEALTMAAPQPEGGSSPMILIAGSLYLAGEVLARNNELPA